MDHRMMQLRRSLDCMTKSGKNFRVLDLYLCSRTNSGSFMVDKLTISGVVFTLIVFLQVMWGCNNKNYNDAAAGFLKHGVHEMDMSNASSPSRIASWLYFHGKKF